MGENGLPWRYNRTIFFSIEQGYLLAMAGAWSPVPKLPKSPIIILSGNLKIPSQSSRKVRTNVDFGPELL